ncbi:DNA replication protein DnaD [Pediococcus acidilactici]|uniref:DNA replication protein DnaD n=1 Tax=Pediococcus acidilactici TaxID=1254 RepID=UPI00130F854E|nr:DNA replication protein DnaD [Pediococcus acidilactici]KAF0341471.1 DNA replication protein DnaD [Pediococcus acidilactici]KAF0353000.1 DNA replication protein DnaD [Pediococcus acidilactici]KAF0356807.1 DNA replication protein DnaD [Pediococcus acidilactici]KAF0376878.1 DNA replication protein DnaD [Pediococcus acidilactici]KAF0398882.1 DNA replication protein DnaD [Pediococcus acidilactici]
MQGWIKLYRSLLEDSIWQLSTPEQKSILITIMLLASHKEKEWEWNGSKFQINPGQFITSIDSLAKKSGKGISVQNVRTSLKRFEKLGFLTNQSTKTGRLITVDNWGKYQDEEIELTKQLTDSQQRPNKDLTPIKNDKNNKNIDHENFEKLWKLYPRKEGDKKRAEKAYLKAIKNGVTNKEIQTGIVNYIVKIKAEGIERKYIAQGSTWFNQNRWTDEYVIETESKTTSDGQRVGKTPEEIVNKEAEHLKEIERRAQEAKANNEH